MGSISDEGVKPRKTGGENIRKYLKVNCVTAYFIYDKILYHCLNCVAYTAQGLVVVAVAWFSYFGGEAEGTTYNVKKKNNKNTSEWTFEFWGHFVSDRN